MDEISVIAALQPGTPDNEEHIRARARVRLTRAMAGAAGPCPAAAARTRHRSWAFAAVAATVAAAAVGVVLAYGPTNPASPARSAPRSSASGQTGSVRIVTDAFTVQRTGSHGKVYLTGGAAMTDDLSGLQSALIKAGVPAIVRAAAPLSACTYQPAASALEPPSVQQAVVSLREIPAGTHDGLQLYTGLYTFDPTAMPKGSVVFIADRNGRIGNKRGFYGIPHPVVLTSNTVPPCTS